MRGSRRGSKPRSPRARTVTDAAGSPRPRAAHAAGSPRPRAAEQGARAAEPGPLPAAALRALEEYVFHLSLVRGASPRTVAAYHSDLVGLFRALSEQGVAGPAQIEEAHLRRYLIALHERGRRPATVSRARAAIRSLFAFLLDEGIVGSDPTAEIEAPPGWRRIPRTLSLAEVRNLIEGVAGTEPLDLRDRALLECGYGTGARAAELLGLRPESCRWEDRLVRLEGKGGRTRLVPIGDPALQALGAYIDRGRPVLAARRPGRPAAEVFLNARGGRLTRMGFWKILQKRALTAGLRVHVHPHLLRHTYATHLLRGGASLRAVQELLGHARLATTQIYTSVDEAYLLAVHRRCHPRG